MNKEELEKFNSIVLEAAKKALRSDGYKHREYYFAITDYGLGYCKPFGARYTIWGFSSESILEMFDMLNDKAIKEVMFECPGESGWSSGYYRESGKSVMLCQ